MALKNLLPLHKKDENGENTHQHHHHEHRQRANGHIVKKESSKKKRQRGITSKWRNELVAMTAEFCGTFLFLFFAFGGTQVANTAALFSDASTAGQEQNGLTQAPNTSVLLYISLIFGFSLMVNVWVFFRVSGSLCRSVIFTHCITGQWWIVQPSRKSFEPANCSLAACTSRRLMRSSGYARSLPYRCPHYHPRHSLLHLADASWHLCRSSCLGHVSW